MKIKIPDYWPTSKNTWAIIGPPNYVGRPATFFCHGGRSACLELGRHCLDVDGHCLGAVHDHPWPVIVLRRHGAKQKRPVGAHAVFRHHITHDRIVGFLWIQYRVRRRRSLSGEV